MSSISVAKHRKKTNSQELVFFSLNSPLAEEICLAAENFFTIFSNKKVGRSVKSDTVYYWWQYSTNFSLPIFLDIAAIRGGDWVCPLLD